MGPKQTYDEEVPRNWKAFNGSFKLFKREIRIEEKFGLLKHPKVGSENIIWAVPASMRSSTKFVSGQPSSGFRLRRFSWAIFLSVAMMQTWIYYNSSNDKIHLRVLIGTVVVLGWTHQVLLSATAYRYLISDFDEPEKLKTLVCTCNIIGPYSLLQDNLILVNKWATFLEAEALVNGLNALLVQCFLGYRVSMLSKNKVVRANRIWITALVGSLVLAEFVCILVYTIIALKRVKTFEELSAKLEGLSITVNALAAAGDLLIAGILAILLQRAKTGHQTSDTILNKLTFFTVNSGTLTSICAVASMISILAAPNSFIYMSFFFCIGRSPVYTNSLLAMLNARKGIRDAAEASTNRNYISDFAQGMGADMVTREDDKFEEKDLVELSVMSSSENISYCTAV
ncbi:hypothetical protein BT96DRAFT_980909 [Gymnopus androsaceus JB14]|uniref:DUF6534 domain-containing protein n=1 Tax=Gymnopus androsaceus JB14 TaxID=1447944 RepID=A0A6A4GSN4_9AGAR|nr:hypothetical protein BT96DRAFT_980909 [Gymnopus androsaceus JB14]